MSRTFGAELFYFICLLIMCSCLLLIHKQSSYSAKMNRQTKSRNIQTRSETTQFHNLELISENVEEVQNGINTCVKRNVSLSETVLPLTGLVSFPGSGNTWTRHLIQQMTGIGTSSVYCDNKLRKKGFPFECHRDQRNRTIVTKTHRSNDISQFTKIILLIRNPYDAFLSFSNFRLSGHIKHPSMESVKKEIDKSLGKFLNWYTQLVRKTSEDFKGPVYVLQYEKLKSKMLSELTKLSKFLGTRQSYNDIICTVNQQEGNFHRNVSDQTHIQLLKYLYEKSQILKIQAAAKYAEDVFKSSYNLDLNLRGPEDKLIKSNEKNKI